MATDARRQRLLIFVVAYNAERTIAQTLRRIPQSLLHAYDTEVLVIDDSSSDGTFEAGRGVEGSEQFLFRLTVLFNPVNQGYGGNQKIGFHYAIEIGFDFVALVHGDGQYAPECLPDLVQPLADGTADAVFGSRMLTRGGARRGGMPVYKRVGNRILTFVQNRLLGSRLSEFHSGYRIYSVDALRKIPFGLNSNVFHFDTEIIIQLLLAEQRVVERAIPTHYGDEICHVNGFRYAKDVVVATLIARIQRWGLFYDPKFDCSPGSSQEPPRSSFPSTHAVALNKIAGARRVLDLGSGLGTELHETACVAIDRHDLTHLDRMNLDLANVDYVLLLDVVEHLPAPERFVAILKEKATFAPGVQVVASTGNVAFIIPRLMLLIGQLNYTRRGILDLTHTRLFTFASFRRLFEQAGFDVLEGQGIPAPFPLALGDTRTARLLLAVNQFLIKLSASLFAYQILLVLRPRPSLAYLLQQARIGAETRARADAAPREAVSA